MVQKFIETVKSIMNEMQVMKIADYHENLNGHDHVYKSLDFENINDFNDYDKFQGLTVCAEIKDKSSIVKVLNDFKASEIFKDFKSKIYYKADDEDQVFDSTVEWFTNSVIAYYDNDFTDNMYAEVYLFDNKIKVRFIIPIFNTLWLDKQSIPSYLNTEDYYNIDNINNLNSNTDKYISNIVSVKKYLQNLNFEFC